MTAIIPRGPSRRRAAGLARGRTRDVQIAEGRLLFDFCAASTAGERTWRIGPRREAEKKGDYTTAYAAPNTLAAFRRSSGFTHNRPPKRFSPAQIACIEMILIPASASLRAIAATAPTRSSA